jgi:hypothetical protein
MSRSKGEECCFTGRDQLDQHVLHRTIISRVEDMTDCDTNCKVLQAYLSQRLFYMKYQFRLQEIKFQRQPR